MSYISKLLGGSVAALLACVTAAHAQSVEDFYSKNAVTLVVAAAPGGASDTYGQQIAPFLSKHLPGHPQVIVTHKPGASGLTAAIDLQVHGKRDGSEIVFLQRNNLYIPLVSKVQVAFDPNKLNWLGSLNKEAYGLMVAASTGIKNWDDAKKAPIKLSATAFDNDNRIVPSLMNEYYGTHFNIVSGYDGTAAMSLALARGEVAGRIDTIDYLYTYASEKPQLKDGSMRIVVQGALERDPEAPDVPTLLELTKDPVTTAVTKFMMMPLEASMPFATAPGVPADRLAALQKGLMDAMNDPDFRAMEAKQGLTTLQPIGGDQVQDIVKQLYATPNDTLDKVRALVNQSK